MVFCEYEKSEWARKCGKFHGLEDREKNKSERNNVSFPFVCCLFSISILLKRSFLKKESSHKHHYAVNHLLVFLISRNNWKFSKLERRHYWIFSSESHERLNINGGNLKRGRDCWIFRCLGLVRKFSVNNNLWWFLILKKFSVGSSFSDSFQ